MAVLYCFSSLPTHMNEEAKPRPKHGSEERPFVPAWPPFILKIFFILMVNIS